jgi:TRAP-type C4-dicarboxylate transport system permease small subunit
MGMKFGKQDAITFLLGAGVALLFTLGEALVRSEELADDPAAWLVNLGIGLGAALGRYLMTELVQRGFVPRE